jgi:hypothetical protein
LNTKFTFDNSHRVTVQPLAPQSNNSSRHPEQELDNLATFIARAGLARPLGDLVLARRPPRSILGEGVLLPRPISRSTSDGAALRRRPTRSPPPPRRRATTTAMPPKKSAQTEAKTTTLTQSSFLPSKRLLRLRLASNNIASSCFALGECHACASCLLRQPSCAKRRLARGRAVSEGASRDGIKGQEWPLPRTRRR